MKNNILNKKVFDLITVDRILGTFMMYFIVFGMVYTIDYWSDRAEASRLAQERAEEQELILAEIARPASDYIEYLSIDPVKSEFDVVEDIEMRSHTIRKESALVAWNDILYCDANADGTFAYIYGSDTSKYYTVDETVESTSEWFFVEPTVRLPRVAAAECYILSQQDICPPELADVEGASCKHQEIKSGMFTLLNRDKQ